MPIIRPPKSAPLTRPRPPKRLTPPMTAAEMESSRIVPQPAEVRAEGGTREGHCEDDRDDPAGVLRQDVVRDVVDLLVLDPDHALRAENLQDQALGDEQPRECDHERGNPDEGDDRSLNQS